MPIRLTGSLGPRECTSELRSYHPEPTFETYGVTGVDHPLSKRVIKASPSEAAKLFLESKIGISTDGLARKAGHESDGLANEYFHQQINGIRVANAVANVAMKENKVVSYGASFIKPRSVAPATPTISQQSAIEKAESITGAKYNSFPIGLEYFVKDTDHVVLTHTVEVQNEETFEWYLVYVDASNGEVVNLVDYTANASYRVVPFTSQDLTDGFSVVTDPQDQIASPNGWHQYGTTTTTSTDGNNVISFIGSTDGTTSQSSAANNYNYIRDGTIAPTEGPNPDAARVNVFYIVNMVHDLTYRYGFTEAKFNFQQSNNGLGGAENDRIEVSLQSSAIGIFSTTPDGRPARMVLGFWSDQHDGAFQNDVTSYEYMHGVSNRLTGGGTSTCLQTTEARGLGEGWSDAFPDLIQRTSEEDRDFIFAEWANGQNLRTYPYSINTTTHPRMYGDLSTNFDLIPICELWAVIWHEIVTGLIAARGFTTNLNDPTLTAGNTVALHLMIDGLSTQPCNPTFIGARDAITQADANRYNGANKCALWKAFAKRGLGYGATTAKINSWTLPSGC